MIPSAGGSGRNLLAVLETAREIVILPHDHPPYPDAVAELVEDLRLELNREEQFTPGAASRELPP